METDFERGKDPKESLGIGPAAWLEELRGLVMKFWPYAKYTEVRLEWFDEKKQIAIGFFHNGWDDISSNGDTMTDFFIWNGNKWEYMMQHKMEETLYD